MALCRSAIVFLLSSLKISRFLERKETLGCRQYQVPWDTSLVWCVVLVHVISEMQVGVLTEAAFPVVCPQHPEKYPSQQELAHSLPPLSLCLHGKGASGSMPTHQNLLSWTSEAVSI